jgi:subtilisin family serine protease
MMRVFSAVLSIIVTAAAFGAGPTHRYTIGVRSLPAHGVFEKEGIDLTGRTPAELRYVGAYVADLTDDEAAALRKSPQVTYVDRDVILHKLDDGTPATVESRNPDVQTVDYGIDLVHARDAWSVTRGANINVAIIDTGIDFTHPDLKDNYAGGATFVAGTSDNRDDEGHGTHVAGIIAAEDNGIGVVGVAPSARLWAIKVLDNTGSGSTSAIVSGINWVIQKKADAGGDWIINMSLGISPCSAQVTDNCATSVPTSLQNACQHAADAGILVFAASGNDSVAGDPAPVSYPAQFSSVLAVGAVDSSQQIADFSNQGTQVAFAAPGVSVLSTYPVGQGLNAFVKNGSASVDAFGLIGSAKGNPSAQYVYCGLGATAGDFPASVKGKIALIQRGTATFNLKTKNALTAGATGVVIYNCSKTATPTTCGNDSPGGWTLIGKLADGTTDDPADLAFAWPVTVGISNADGEALRKAASTTITETNVADDYETLSGTSMASPHAVGVAAVVWGAAPDASAADVRQAMITTAHDLGATGQDTVFGYGLVDAFAAAKALAPAKFGSPITPVPATGRRILKRGGH